MWSKNSKVMKMSFIFYYLLLMELGRIVKKCFTPSTFCFRRNTVGRRGRGKQGDLLLCINIVGIMILQAMTIYKDFSLVSLFPLVMIKANASDEHNI